MSDKIYCCHCFKEIAYDNEKELVGKTNHGYYHVGTRSKYCYPEKPKAEPVIWTV